MEVAEHKSCNDGRTGPLNPPPPCPSTALVQAPLPGETVIFGTINFTVPNGFLLCFVQCCASLSAQLCSHFPCPAVLNVSSFTDDAVRAAYQKAHFPNGLKFSMLEDVDHFGVLFNTIFFNTDFPFSECSKSNMEQPESLVGHACTL